MSMSKSCLHISLQIHSFEGVSEDVTSLAVPLMQKHNIGREDVAKIMEKERKSDQKGMIIRQEYW